MVEADFVEVANILYDISLTGSTIAKRKLLCENENVRYFKDVLKFIYDPYFTTGIKQAKLEKINACDADLSLEDIMKYLKVNSTGDNTDISIANAFIAQYMDEPVAAWAAEGLVTKDLQIGVSVSTLNDVFGKTFIPKIGIMRGMLCPDNADGVYIVTEKIDGNRRLIMNKETGVEIYTRSGKRDHGLVEIEKEAAESLPKGFVFDCECIAAGSFEDSIALRQASASILNRRNQTRTGVRALCFDVLPQAEYDAGKSRLGALARKTIAASMLGDYDACQTLQMFASKMDEQYSAKGKATGFANSVNALTVCYRNNNVHDKIMVLPILGIAHNKEEGKALAMPIWETGGEGVMMVEWMSPYEVNPNPRKTLLKIKMLKEYKLLCVDYYAGEQGKKYADTLGGIIVRYVKDGKTYNVGVGSGFTDDDRFHYWRHPEMIVGRMVEIESFGESKNDQGGYSLNCPIFKRLAGEKE